MKIRFTMVLLLVLCSLPALVRAEQGPVNPIVQQVTDLCGSKATRTPAPKPLSAH